MAMWRRADRCVYFSGLYFMGTMNGCYAQRCQNDDCKDNHDKVIDSVLLHDFLVLLYCFYLF